MATLGRRILTQSLNGQPVHLLHRDRQRKSHWRSRTKTHAQQLYDKQLIVLIIVLLIAASVTLYSAYAVFYDTWGRSSTPLSTMDPVPASIGTATKLKIFTGHRLPETPVLHEASYSSLKYFAYLPHSGFHNQRIALENALVLARILNRTLLLPPVRLGAPLSYLPFDELYEMSANSSKFGLDYCAQTTAHDVDLSLECEEYSSYTYVSWDWLVDISSIRQEQRLVDGWNFTDAWLHDVLNISSGDTFYLKDETRNQFAFQDFPAVNPPVRKFIESVHIPMLARRSERLIMLGTLFGSARLHLRAENTFLLRRHIRERMAFNNPHLEHAASSIHDALGGSYLGVHMRIRDGIFEWSALENVRLAWWKLLHVALGYSDEELLTLESELFPEEDALEPPVIAPDIPAMRSPHPPLPVFPADATPSPGHSCRGSLHDQSNLRILNVPLFIATDAHNPSVNSLLWRFTRTFPCSFFLEDFPEHTWSLTALRSESDGVPLGPFLMPFLDAMVVAQAWQVVGTEQSTFSAFVTDVLWRTHHGFEIVQRG